MEKKVQKVCQEVLVILEIKEIQVTDFICKVNNLKSCKRFTKRMYCVDILGISGAPGLPGYAGEKGDTGPKGPQGKFQITTFHCD